MRATFGVVTGWCGFGCSGGLVPSLRLGVIELWCCRGSIVLQVAKLRQALADAAAELRGKR